MEHGTSRDHSGHQAATERRDEVAERGRGVVPFDLERTTHRFRRLPDGGKQTVVADDARDRRKSRGSWPLSTRGFEPRSVTTGVTPRARSVSQ